MGRKIQIIDLIKFKESKEKFTCLTAYDYRTAQILDTAGIELILVGDSLANTFLGLDSTQDVGMPEMLYHLKAVRRGVTNALVVADMPFGSYQVSQSAAIDNAVSLIKAGADAVKLEGAGDYNLNIIKHLVSAGIPVIGHIGYTPQSSNLIGKGRIQGKSDNQAKQLIKDAVELEKAGVSALVLELMPGNLASDITQKLPVPTIGIGSGLDCDSQILVTDDLLGRYDFKFNFVKQYANLGEIMKESFLQYKKEVKDKKFPEQ